MTFLIGFFIWAATASTFSRTADFTSSANIPSAGFAHAGQSLLTPADHPETATSADSLARFQLSPVIWQLMPRSGSWYRAQIARVPLNMVYFLLAALAALLLCRPAVRFYHELLILFHFQCLLKGALPVRAGPLAA